MKRNQIFKNMNSWGFPGGAVVENLPANAGDTGSSPGLGRSHMPRSGMGDARGRGYGDICIHIADTLCYTAETNTTL